jgi:hypothetical protein
MRVCAVPILFLIATLPWIARDQRDAPVTDRE